MTSNLFSFCMLVLFAVCVIACLATAKHTEPPEAPAPEMDSAGIGYLCVVGLFYLSFAGAFIAVVAAMTRMAG